uniref:Uncharacterized protein n=1 Tax=Rhizophora mucronata TaxID=61149 RepID=A0A2P2MSH5_RHIMU
MREGNRLANSIRTGLPARETQGTIKMRVRGGLKMKFLIALKNQIQKT